MSAKKGVNTDASTTHRYDHNWIDFIGNHWLAADSKKEAVAISQAKKWLTLVDSEKYAESWKEAVELFKNVIQPQQWKQSIQAVRGPSGDLMSRKVKTKAYKTSLPSTPDGEYVVIQLETSFENKKVAVETVTPMMGKEGVWRVSGYYIK